MKDINIITLAYLGDAIYELYIRKYLLFKKIVKVKELQQEAIKYVSAKSQSKFLKYMLCNNIFNEEELSIIYRARNHKGTNHPKNTDILTYKHATAIEALIGYLEVTQNNKRIDEIMNIIFKLENEEV